MRTEFSDLANCLTAEDAENAEEKSIVIEDSCCRGRGPVA